MKLDVCPYCGKLCFPNRKMALEAIESLKRKKEIGPRPENAFLNIYPCEKRKHIWHIGDSIKSTYSPNIEKGEEENCIEHFNKWTY